MGRLAFLRWSLLLSSVLTVIASPAVFRFDQKPKLDQETTCGYQACDLGDPDKLNVHLVAHTHDDVGWLKTVDQYFYGAHNEIQHAGVQYILDTVIQSLEANPRRRFIYVEVAFFWRWWNEQDDFVRHLVKDMVNKGRLEFILGGWCMNDEASTHYNAIIDQHTLGFKFLRQNFGECGTPRIGWQIDPFGHSREQASLFAQFGFDGLFFGRLDYQDKNARLKQKTMEHMWMGSQNLGEQSSLFTGVNFNGYSPPGGFCFDVGCTDAPFMLKLAVLLVCLGDAGTLFTGALPNGYHPPPSINPLEPFMDDARLEDYNVEERINDFLKAVNDQAKHYTTNHIMITMGSDFQFENAHENFKQIDKLIHYVNQYSETLQLKVNVLYSTPSCYLYALNQANQTYTAKSDDFFPYASDPHVFWTGYFTSRPALKGYVRSTNNFLQVCKQLDTLSQLESTYGSNIKLDVLREAMGVAQHHDAVSGTEKQAVAYDYAMRLARGIKECQDVVNYAYAKLMPKPGISAGPTQEFCTLLNVSHCPATESNSQFTVTAYNPLGRPSKWSVRLPVTGRAYQVHDQDLQAVSAQLVPLTEATGKIPEHKGSKATATLVFNVQMPPLGFATYFITQTQDENVETKQQSKVSAMDASDMSIKNEYLRLDFSAATGRLKGVTNLVKGISIPVQQELLYYKSYQGNDSEPQFHSSGAYVFRPNGTDAIPIATGPVQIKVVKGQLVEEVQQTFSTWASQVIRLYAGHNSVEIEWTVGPIPAHDEIGKEVISRFTTDLKTQPGTFYTDANGREILKRVRDYRPTWPLNQTEPVAGNYYPVNSRIYIKDESRDIQLTLLTDRSQGGASIRDGQMEVMVHRRLFNDDNMGVGEALNETGISGDGLVVRGFHYLVLESIGDSSQVHRDLAERLYMAPSFSFAKLDTTAEQYKNMYKTQWSGLKRALSDNVHLLTLEQWEGTSFLLRLEHFYEKGEDPQLSKPATVSLKDLFTPFSVESVEELTLGANQKLIDAKRLSWNVQGHGRTNGDMSSFVTPVNPQTLEVVLQPMQIRTFKVNLQA